jgi:hypothetical protein
MKCIEGIVYRCLIIFKKLKISPLYNLGDTLCGGTEEYVSSQLIDSREEGSNSTDSEETCYSAHLLYDRN